MTHFIKETSPDSPNLEKVLNNCTKLPVDWWDNCEYKAFKKFYETLKSVKGTNESPKFVQFMETL
jgi:hypothetical protein